VAVAKRSKPATASSSSTSRRAEMRATAFQRRIAAIIVGQPLEIGEGNVGARTLSNSGRSSASSRLLSRRCKIEIAGEEEGKDHAGNVRVAREACQIARLAFSG